MVFSEAACRNCSCVAILASVSVSSERVNRQAVNAGNLNESVTAVCMGDCFCTCGGNPLENIGQVYHHSRGVKRCILLNYILSI